MINDIFKAQTDNAKKDWRVIINRPKPVKSDEDKPSKDKESKK